MFVNMTPHSIVIGEITIEPSGAVARCKEISEPAGEHNGVPLVRRTYGQVENLPEPCSGVLYVVSALVRLACPERTDLVSPGDQVRDADGRIIGCKNLVVNG